MRSGWSAHLCWPMGVGGDSRQPDRPLMSRGRQQVPARDHPHSRDRCTEPRTALPCRRILCALAILRSRAAGRSGPHSVGVGRQPIRMIGLNGNRPSSQVRVWSIPAAHRFKSQPDRKCSCNLQIAIELQRSAGRVAPFRMAKIDIDVITDIAAERKIDGKSRILHADVDARSSEDQPHDSKFRAARRHA